MTASQIHQLINENTKGLPLDVLEEVLDFIEFLKSKKLKASKDYKALSKMNSFEEQHLLEEFADYKTLHPSE